MRVSIAFCSSSGSEIFSTAKFYMVTP